MQIWKKNYGSILKRILMLLQIFYLETSRMKFDIETNRKDLVVFSNSGLSRWLYIE